MQSKTSKESTMCRENGNEEKIENRDEAIIPTRTEKGVTDEAKCVRWASTPCTLHVFEPLSDNPKETWYLRKDLATFREQCEITRILARKGFGASNFTSCWGLEHTICEELSQNRSNRKQEALDTVIEEQQGQREDGVFMPEFIADIYQDITKLSQMEAHQQALRYSEELTQEDVKDAKNGVSKVQRTDNGMVELRRNLPGVRKRKSYTTPMA